eukprot:Ihof_evm1s1234 gene=Ihof_evmTU1s1234
MKKQMGPALEGTIANIMTLIIQAVATFTNYWVKGQYGHVGLWTECLYGFPCIPPTDKAVYVARVFVMLSLAIGCLSVLLGLGILTIFRNNLPSRVLASFAVGLAGFLGIIAAAVFMAGFYLGMPPSWSWALLLLGALVQIFGVAPLY